MSAQTNPKVLLINILKDQISVEDDSAGALTGIVAGTWYDERVIGDHAWMVTVGPTIFGDAKPADLGANVYDAHNSLVLNIWIPIIENADYTPERLKFSVKEEIKRLLKAELINTVSDVHLLFIDGWRDLDDRENDMLRAEITVQVKWYET